MTAATENDPHGNTIARAFYPSRERYHYDFRACTPAKGWRQYDTSQEKILTFAEGDETVVTCPSPEHFRGALARMAEFFGEAPPAFIVIGADGRRTDVYDPRPTGDDA